MTQRDAVWMIRRVLVSLAAVLLLSCSERPPRKVSKNAEYLTRAETSADPAIHAEVYIPVYSNLSYSHGRVTVELSAQLTIRNTDSSSPIILDSVRYYDSAGHFLRDEISEPQTLAPMATTTFLVVKKDTEGGVGANYLVRWRAVDEVTEPLMEAVMADLSSSFALAFTSRGVTTRLVRGRELEEPSR